MNTHTRARRYTELEANKYRGRMVRESDGKVVQVTKANPSGDGKRIILTVWDGYFTRTTDNEHATIVPAVGNTPDVLAPTKEG